MMSPISLSDREADVILQLLEAERRELAPEIRRTDTIKVHDDLLEREKMVDELIQRLNAAKAVH